MTTTKYPASRSHSTNRVQAEEHNHRHCSTCYRPKHPDASTQCSYCLIQTEIWRVST